MVTWNRDSTKPTPKPLERPKSPLEQSREQATKERWRFMAFHALLAGTARRQKRLKTEREAKAEAAKALAKVTDGNGAAGTM